MFVSLYYYIYFQKVRSDKNCILNICSTSANFHQLIGSFLENKVQNINPYWNPPQSPFFKKKNLV